MSTILIVDDNDDVVRNLLEKTRPCVAIEDRTRRVVRRREQDQFGARGDRPDDGVEVDGILAVASSRCSPKPCPTGCAR